MLLRKSYRIVVALLSVFYSNLVFSQNEAFHGGEGDGFGYAASGIIDMSQVSYEGPPLTVTINQADNQPDTTNVEPIKFTVVFSELVNDFDETDIEVLDVIRPDDITISGNGTVYTVEISGIKNNGEISALVVAGGVHNAIGMPNQVSAYTDNTVVYSGADLTVEVYRALGQNYFTKNETVHFDAIFNDDVIDFNSSDVQFGGSAFPSSVVVTGAGKDYDLAVSGMQQDGEISINIPQNIAHNQFGTPNNESINTESTVWFDNSSPTAEILLAAGQTDTAYEEPLRFKVVFSEDVFGFNEGSISFGGSAGLEVQVSGSGSEYDVEFSGAVTNETVTMYVPDGVVLDFAGNKNVDTDNIDNSITFLGRTTGIDNFIAQFDAKIYYAHGSLMVLFNEIPKGSTFVEIYSLRGQIIQRKQIQYKLNTIGLPLLPNIYLVRLIRNGDTYDTKIFVR